MDQSTTPGTPTTFCHDGQRLTGTITRVNEDRREAVVRVAGDGCYLVPFSRLRVESDADAA
jgi:predicted lipoprotein